MNIKHNIDRHGRPHTYIRISLTDRCNLSCSYCMPKNGLNLSDLNDQLRPDEIIKIIRISALFGINKVRFTGGEPLCRKDIDRIISAVKNIKGIERVSITTNGVLLSKRINALKEAGIDSINISLDSLNPERFSAITGKDVFNEVMNGIFMAVELGFRPKVNVVALNDLDTDEVDRFYAFASKHPIVVRFIEFMPLCGENIGDVKFSSVKWLEQYIVEKYKLKNAYMDGVAKIYPLNGKEKGAIGIISPISHPFCSDCNRLRISSAGILYGCLFDSRGINIRNILRNGAGEETIMNLFEQVLLWKNPSHGIDEPLLKERMSEIKNLIRLIGG
ncbi:MAG: GTP 3',8-cyclase MoaA [Nitrospinota bacterium]